MASKGKKATAADAQVVMQLYDLRRESEMRKARKFYAETQFNTFEDFQKVSMAWGTPENAWLRQVLTYWENAATLVLRGAVNPDLFFDWNGEMIFTYMKVKPFIKQVREIAGPEFMKQTETLLNSTPALRKRVADFEQRMAKWRERMASAPAAAAAARR